MKDVFLFLGQSNMQGQTGSLPQKNDAVQGAEEYLYLSDTVRPLRHPVGENIGFDGKEGRCDLSDALLGAWENGGSLLPYFCDAYCRASGREVLAVHAAKGSTTISYWQKGGTPYDLVTKKFRAAEEKIGKENVAHRYAVFLQGESDALESTDEETYLRLLASFGKALKEDLGIERFFVIRVGRFANDERDFPILAAQEKLCAKDPFFVMLTRATGELLQKDGFTFYEGHYNNLAFSVLGEIAGRHAADFVDGKPVALEEEPYAAFTEWQKRRMECGQNKK